MVRYILINVGCIECGVSTEVVGVYNTEREAAKAQSEQTDWRGGGQSSAEIFKIEV